MDSSFNSVASTVQRFLRICILDGREILGPVPGYAFAANYSTAAPVYRFIKSITEYGRLLDGVLSDHSEYIRWFC